MIEKINFSKEQSMLKTTERFLEKEINETEYRLITAGLICERLTQTFNTYKMIALGDIFGLVESMKTGLEVGLCAYKAPNYEYFNYGYNPDTGFKCRLTTICNLNPKSEKDSVHVMLEFNDPKILESKS